MRSYRLSHLFGFMIGIIGLYGLVGVSCHCALVVPPATFQDPALGPGDLAKDTIPTADCLKARPALKDFGGIPIACNQPLKDEIELYHTGHSSCPSSLKIMAVQLQKTEQTGFGIVSRPALPHTLKSGESFKIQLSFHTKLLQLESNKLVVTSDIPEQENVLIDLQGRGVEELPRQDTFQQVFQATDILFVVDVSRSMRQEQEFLAGNFKSFIQWAQRLHSDFQIGVIPIETGTKQRVCLVGVPKILTPNTPNLAAAFEKNATGMVSQSGREQGLETAYRALQEPMRSDPTCNGGFVRDHAILSMIFISDEPDQSDRPYEFYYEFFKNLKGPDRSHMIRASVVVGPTPSGCLNAYGSAKAGPRYLQLAADLQGVQASICEANWAKTLEKIGLISLLERLRYKLTRKPKPNSIRVLVDNKLIPQDTDNGWRYESSSNEIFFRGEHVPHPGNKIDIQYLVDCDE